MASSYRKSRQSSSTELRRSSSSAAGLTGLRKLLFAKSGKSNEDHKATKVEIIRSLSDLQAANGFNMNEANNVVDSDDGGFDEANTTRRYPSVSLEDVRLWQKTMGEL
jgi:hypothetical protein